MYETRCPNCKAEPELQLFSTVCPVCGKEGLRAVVNQKPYARHWRYKGYREVAKTSFEGSKAMTLEELERALADK